MKLQQLDLTIRSLGHQLQQLSKKNKALDEKVKPQKEKVDGAQKEIETLTERTDNLGSTLGTLEEKERKQKMRIPEVRSNDEYSALLREMDAVKREREQAETQSLKDMERIEELKGELPALEEELGKAEESFASERGVIEKEKAKLESSLLEAKEQRQAVQGEMHPGWFRKYTHVAAQRNGIAVVAVKDGTCQGCFMGVRPKLVQDLHYDEDVVFCEGCARVLYLGES